MKNQAKKSVRTSVLLPEESYSRVQSLADANDVSTAWVIRQAVLRFLDDYMGEAQLSLRFPAAVRKSEG